MKFILSKYTIAAGLACSMLFSCQDDFEEINADPNRLEAVLPGTLLAPALLNASNVMLSRTHRISHELMQYTVQTNTIDEFHRYVFRDTEPDYLWKNLYRWATNANDMYDLASELNDKNNMAVALVVRSWIMANVTDLFGDVPYSEAFQGDERVYYPKFDSQKEIYMDLLADLKEANELIDLSKPLAANDPLYNGDMMKWKKFSNSLRLRLLMRVSGKEEMNAPAAISEIYNNPEKYPLFTSNEDAATFNYTGTAPFVNPFSEWRAFEFNGNRDYGSTFINILNDANDPRRAIIATKVGGTYVGIESGQPENIVTDQHALGASTYNDKVLKKATQPAYILPYSEVLFNLAEAAQKGWINADAEELYTNAVIASVEQWGATATEEFLQNENIAYNGTMEQLMEQKYVALFFVGFESWYEYRRTGMPELFKGSALQNNGLMPVRLEYPVIVQATNKASYDAAVQQMGGDDMNVKVWWQKE